MVSMAPRVEHELHHRRRSRNLGLLAVLLALVVLILGMTVAKVREGSMMQGYDHNPDSLPTAAAPATTGARP